MQIKNSSHVAPRSKCIKEDPFMNFPIGLLILEKENKSNYRIAFSNTKANELLAVPTNYDIETFQKKLRYYKKLTSLEKFNYDLNGKNLCDQIFSPNSTSEIVNEKYVSLTFMIYVKIRYLEHSILVSIDNYEDERQSIQTNIVKSLGHRYLLTLYHEINNPLNSLLTSIENIVVTTNKRKKEKLRERIALLVNLIKIFIKNFVLTFQIAFEETKKFISKSNINLEFIFTRVSSKFTSIFKYKEIAAEQNFRIFSNKIISTEYFYFRSLLKNIFIFLYHKIDRGGGFTVEVALVGPDQAKVYFKNKHLISSGCPPENKTQLSRNTLDKSFIEEFDMSKAIQTLDMTRDMILKIAKLLEIKVKIREDAIKPYYAKLYLQYKAEIITEENVDSVDEFSPQTERKKQNAMMCVQNKRIQGHFLKNQNEKKVSFKNFGEIPNNNISSSSQNESSSSDNMENETNEIRDSVKTISKLKNIDKTVMMINCDNTISSKNINGRNVNIGTYQDNIIPVKPCDRLCETSSASPEKEHKINFNRSPKRNLSLVAYHGNNCLIDTFNIISLNVIKSEDIIKTPQGTCYIPLKPEVSQACFDVNQSLIPNENTINISDTCAHEASELCHLISINNSHQNSSSGHVQIPPVKQYTQKNFTRVLNPRDSFPITAESRKKILKKSKSINPHIFGDYQIEESQCECECKDVLLVDDEIFNLNSLKYLMKGNHISVDVAQNGRQCIEKINEKKNSKCMKCTKDHYRLIMMDIVMPEMNGLEASQAIQEMVDKGEINKDIKICIVSSNEREEIQCIIKKIPIIQEFIPKPVKKSKIEEIVRKYYLDQ